MIAIGMTLSVAPLTSTVMAAVDPAHTGSASGVNNATAYVGSMIATALLGLVLGHGRFQGAAVAGAALAAAAAASALLFVSRP
jgi:predicted MFS family arabinose efflux permease